MEEEGPRRSSRRFSGIKFKSMNSVSPKAKFRTIVRKVVENWSWFPSIMNGIKENKHIDKEKGAYVDFEHDLLSLREIIQELVKNCHLRGFEAGRELFREGDESLRAYFILKGVVEVKPLTESDPLMDLFKRIFSANTYNRVVSADSLLLEKGEMIGRKEVLFGERRDRIATVKEDVLVIRFEKKHMIEVLQSLINQWNEITKCLTNYEIFKFFPFSVIREIVKMGKIRYYQPNLLLKTDKTANFLVDGEVSVIQRLLIQTRNTVKGQWHRLYKDQSALTYGSNVTPVYMKVCILRSGAFFGLGERMSKNQFWTNKISKFVEFPNDELVQYGESAYWEGQTKMLDAIFPTVQELFLHWIYNRRWAYVKHEVVKQCKKPTNNNNTIHNVPIPIRSKHIKLRKDFEKCFDIKNMDDYLVGGTGPLEEEIPYTYVLDKYGKDREFVFGKFKNAEKVDYEQNKNKYQFDEDPLFFYYNAIQRNKVQI